MHISLILLNFSILLQALLLQSHSSAFLSWLSPLTIFWSWSVPLFPRTRPPFLPRSRPSFSVTRTMPISGFWPVSFSWLVSTFLSWPRSSSLPGFWPVSILWFWASILFGLGSCMSILRGDPILSTYLGNTILSIYNFTFFRQFSLLFLLILDWFRWLLLSPTKQFLGQDYFLDLSLPPEAFIEAQMFLNNALEIGLPQNV